MNIPTGPKPAWVQNLQDGRSLLDAYRRTHGPQSVPLGTEIFITIQGRGYVAFPTAPRTYTILGHGGQTTCVTSVAIGDEPGENASDAEWDAYMNTPAELEAAVVAAGI